MISPFWKVLDPVFPQSPMLEGSEKPYGLSIRNKHYTYT
jgi:hypothetical protein